MEKKANILVVDDDLGIRETLQAFLEQQGFFVYLAENGEAMEKVLAKEAVDLIILDVMMPGDDGFALVRKLRATSSIPIIMLTAVSEDTDRIVGLELGADDYVTKPFNPRELLARIKALFRRTEESSSTGGATKELLKLHFSGWTLNKATRRLTSPDDIEVELSAGEYDLLLAFLTHPRRVLNREQLLDLAKNRAAVPFDRSIDVQISRLRQKIEDDPKKPELIKTVRGGGYTFTSEVTKS